jgi:hypothetical protein
MKNLNRFFMMVCVSILFTPLCQAQTTDNLSKTISNAFNTDNMEMLSGLFSDDVELILPDGKSSTTKNAIKTMLSNFINTKQVSGFQVLHQGQKGNRMFIIGNFVSQSTSYRINLFLKNDSGNFLIYQLKIE